MSGLTSACRYTAQAILMFSETLFEMVELRYEVPNWP